MRIGVDLQVLEQKPWTGIPKYAYHLARALRELQTNHEFVFFVPENSPSLPLFDQRGGRGEFIVLPSKTIPFWSAHVTYARVMQKARLDVLHGPANVSPFLPLPEGRGRVRGGKVVLTIHDLAIYKHPEWFPRRQWFSTKIVVPQSIKKADAIIVPSQATKRDLLELFGVGESKVHVVPHGFEERFFEYNASAPSPLSSSVAADGEGKGVRKYILFVGTLEPRKNVRRLIEAYQLLPEEIRAEYELWIVGGTPSSSPPIRLQTGGERGSGFSPSQREGGEQEGVRFLGYIPDEDLPALYQNASIFVYPSLYEGFGLPVLEAMAAGVPVVTSRGTAMEEILHNASLPPLSFPPEADPPLAERGGKGELVPGVLVDPYSPQDIANGIEKPIRDVAYSREISEKARELAHKFTWEKAAKATLAVYESLAYSKNPHTYAPSRH